MNVKNYLIVILLFCFFKVKGQIPKYSFSKSEITSDIFFLIDKYEEIHPSPYLHTKKDIIESYVSNIIKNLEEQTSLVEARRITGGLSSKFVFGHSDISPFNSLYPTETVHEFPFWVKIFDGKIFISKNISNNKTIQPFSEITSINNIPSSEIVNVMMNSVSGESKGFKERFLSFSFSTYLNFFFDIEGPEFQIEIRQKEGSSNKYNIQRGDVIKTNSQDKRTLFDISHIGNKTSIIEIKSFSNKKDYRLFLDQSFKEISEKNIEKLVIDIRDNGGGNSNLIKYLVAYLTDKPIIIFNGSLEKTSKTSKKYYRNQYLKWYLYPIYPLLYFIPGASPKFTKREGSLTKFQKEIVRPKSSQNRFRGDIYLLVNEGTFSTASVLSSALQCSGIVKVVGRSTGEPTIGDGNSVTVKLPNTKTHHDIGTTLYYNACHLNTDEFKMMKTDIFNGDTDELEYLLTWISKNSTSS